MGADRAAKKAESSHEHHGHSLARRATEELNYIVNTTT